MRNVGKWHRGLFFYLKKNVFETLLRKNGSALAKRYNNFHNFSPFSFFITYSYLIYYCYYYYYYDYDDDDIFYTIIIYSNKV